MVRKGHCQSVWRLINGGHASITVNALPYSNPFLPYTVLSCPTLLCFNHSVLRHPSQAQPTQSYDNTTVVLPPPALPCPALPYTIQSNHTNLTAMTLVRISLKNIKKQIRIHQEPNRLKNQIYGLNNSVPKIRY